MVSTLVRKHLDVDYVLLPSVVEADKEDHSATDEASEVDVFGVEEVLVQC